MCRLNCTSACYKASTKTQIKYKNSIATPKQKLYRQNKNNVAGKKGNIKEVLGHKPQTLKKT
jgi:hypothetical protein